MGLLDSLSSSAYVLKSDLTMSASSYADKFLSGEDAAYQSPRPNLPLLREMIQISCSPFKASRVQTERAIDDHRDIDETMLEKSREASRRIDMMITEDDELADETERSTRKEAAEKKTMKDRESESERLDELLEKCNLVQNSIAEKLCIYF